MPVLFSREHWQDWLAVSPDYAVKLIAPYDSNELHAWAVSRKVNKSSAEGLDLIEKA